MAELDYYDEQGLSAVYYDLITSVDPACWGDVDFYAALLAPGSAVLELGCGTGRVAFALAGKGHKVVGLDLSPAMAKRAVLKQRKAAPEVAASTQFLLGDMTAFSLDRRFDAVLAPYFAFAHLPLGEPRRQALACIARHLRPGGLAALHLPLGGVQHAPTAEEAQRPTIDLAYDPDGRRITVYARDGAWAPETGRFELLMEYVDFGPGGVERRRSRERLCYNIADPTADAAEAGLALERKVSPYNLASEIFVFRRV